MSMQEIKTNMENGIEVNEIIVLDLKHLPHLFFFNCSRYASSLSGLAFTINGLGQIIAPMIGSKIIQQVKVTKYHMAKKIIILQKFLLIIPFKFLNQLEKMGKSTVNYHNHQIALIY